MLRKSALPRQKALLLAIGCALAIPLFAPSPAQAWWVRGGWGWRPGFAVGVVVAAGRRGSARGLRTAAGRLRTAARGGRPLPPPLGSCPLQLAWLLGTRALGMTERTNWRGTWVPGHWT